jgi:mannan endo-1,4-beta-mannosidase
MTARSSFSHAAAALIAALALVGALLASAQPAQAAVGLHVENGRLYEANGNEFIMRGVSHPHAWFTNQVGSLADIASLGANTVRVVLASGDRWTRTSADEVATIIEQCKVNELICMLEVHDTTGYGEEPAAGSLDAAVDYWVSIADVLEGEEDHVLINIGNEPIGNGDTVVTMWADHTTAAITRMRDAGFEHTLIVDAPNWGQDWTFTMRDTAAQVYPADPTGNTMFSIHMYGVFDTADEITSYLDTFVEAGLPILVGEFGHGDVDEDTVMAHAEALELGYIGWSWSGNTDPILDMVLNFDIDNLTAWGERIFNGPDGIVETARTATIYGDADPDPTETPTPDPTEAPTPDPGTDGCSAAYTVIGQWPGGFQGEVAVTASDAAISGWTVTWTLADGQSINQSWSADTSTSGSTVTASNVSYNGDLAAGATTRFGFIGSWSGTNPVPTVTCQAG